MPAGDVFDVDDAGAAVANQHRIALGKVDQIRGRDQADVVRSVDFGRIDHHHVDAVVQRLAAKQLGPMLVMAVR